MLRIFRKTRHDEESTLKSTLRNHLNPTDSRVVELILENANITIGKIVAELGLSREGVRKSIKRLKLSNIIRRVGPDNGGHWEVVSG